MSQSGICRLRSVSIHDAEEHGGVFSSPQNGGSRPRAPKTSLEFVRSTLAYRSGWPLKLGCDPSDEKLGVRMVLPGDRFLYGPVCRESRRSNTPKTVDSRFPVILPHGYCGPRIAPNACPLLPRSTGGKEECAGRALSTRSQKTFIAS
jgi:hypothetical protein